MGRLHFESLSPANYKRMTLISEVSQFGITPVPFLKHGGRCCWRGSFHVSPQQYSESLTRSEMEQFPTVVPCMNKQMINSHMIASDQRITKCFPVMSLSACSVCTVWCKAVVSPRCPSCYTDRDRLCCAWTHEVSEHMEHMAQIHDIWTPTMSTNVTEED